jgi:hypothetical protein
VSFKTHVHVSYSPDYFCDSCRSHGSVYKGNQVIYHDNGDSRFLWNVSAYLLENTASHSRLHLSSWLYSFISFKTLISLSELSNYTICTCKAHCLRQFISNAQH